MEEKTLNEKMMEQYEVLAQVGKTVTNAYQLAEVSLAMVEVYKVLKASEKQDKLETELKEIFNAKLNDLGNTLVSGKRSVKPVS
jgi:hypothetical protein